MNIKKLFATLAGVSMFVSTVVPATTFGATYSEELQGAYDWAYAHSITTMDSIDRANMYGDITRAQMAKMLANYAKEFTDKEMDASASCSFNDVASVQGDLSVAIVEACQFGIMGQGITSFRPYDTITRAEFGTALSRLLWGNEYEGGTPYYANHLNALKSAGIMNQIANAANTKEVRGYVMLMLQRAAGEDSEAEACDALTLVACSVDPTLDGCDACNAGEEDNNNEEDVVVKSGDLAVTASAAEDRKVIVSSEINAASDLDTLTFKTSEEVTISKVVLEKYGYSDANELVSNVWLEDEDGNQLTNKARPNTKGLVNLTMKKDYKVVDGTLNATIVLETKLGSVERGTIGFKVVDATSTAKNLNLSKYSPYTYDVVAYDGSVATIKSRGGEKVYNYEAGESYEIAKFNLRAPDDTSILVKGFTLTNLDRGDTYSLDAEEFLDKITVTVDGKEVKATTSINKDEELSVSFAKDLELSAKSNVDIAVSATLSDDFDEYGTFVYFGIASTKDLSATDKNNARISIVNNGSWTECRFLGGKVKVTNNKLGKVEASTNSTDNLIAEGTITVSEEIEGTVWTRISQSSFSGGLNPSDVIESARLVVAGEEYDGEIDRESSVAYLVFKNVDVSESGKVKLYVDIDDDPRYEGKSMTFSSLNWDMEYSEGRGDVDMVGNITPSALSINAVNPSFTNKLTKLVEFPVNETNIYNVLEGTYTAKKGLVNLNYFAVVANTVDLDFSGNDITFYLVIDGTEVADVQLGGWSDIGWAYDTFTDIEIDANESVDVVVKAEVAAQQAAKLGDFEVVLGGTDKNGNDVEYKTKDTVKIDVVNMSSVTVPATTSAKTVLLKAANTTIAEFTVKPANNAENANIDSIKFTLGGSIDSDDITVTVDGKEIEADLVSANPTYSDINVDTEKNGVVVKVVLDDEDDAMGEITLTGLYVNTLEFNRTFSKKFEEAIVYIANQNGGEGTTTLTLGVEEFDSSVNVSDLRLYVGSKVISNNGELVNPDEYGTCSSGAAYTTKAACTAATGNWTVGYTIEGSFSDGETIEVVESSSAVQMITAIDYYVDGEHDGIVSIEKSSYNDYFKVGSSYAKIFKANN